MRTDQMVETGFDVVDRNGEKIGNVEDVSANYFLVTKGLFFPKDFYIPTSAVEEIDDVAGTIRINAGRDEIEAKGWDTIPDHDVDAVASGDIEDATTTTSDSFTVPLREEQLRTDRRGYDAGEVSVGKRVIEQEQSVDVPLTHEEVEITRRRVDRPADAADEITDDGTTIRVPVRAEELDVRKDARIVEEVEISKRPVTETRRVSETVRREEIDVDAQGDVAISGADSKHDPR